MGYKCFQVSLCKWKTWRRKTFNINSCVYVHCIKFFLLIDVEFVCMEWYLDLCAVLGLMKRWFNCWVRSPFPWTKVWDLKFCDLNYEDVHCAFRFSWLQKIILNLHTHILFFLHWLKRLYATRIVCLEYFIFRYCFLTHVAVHISLLLFKL